MALPLSPAPRRGRAAGTSRRAPARLPALTWPAALTALACCGLAACGATSAPSAGTTRTVTVQPSAAPATPGGATTPAAAPASQAPSGLHTCLASDLKGSVGSTEGAAGTFYTDVVLTNISSSACSLYGYPGVSFVTAPGGSEVGAAADRNPISPAQVIKVAPGSQVNFLMGLTDVGVYPASECQPTSVSWLRVYPPGDYGSLYVQYSAQTCAVTSLVVLRVSTVRAGLTGTGA